MIYKFRIVSDEVDNFRREICIDSDATFLDLHDAILDSVGFTKDQMTSFFICDDDWRKRPKSPLVDMGKDSDEDTWIMSSTRLSELIEDEGQRLVFVFDYMTDRMFFMELKEIEPGKDLDAPSAPAMREIPRNRPWTSRNWRRRIPPTTHRTSTKISMETKPTTRRNSTTKALPT